MRTQAGFCAAVSNSRRASRPPVTTTQCCCTGAMTRPRRWSRSSGCWRPRPRSPSYRNLLAVLLSRVGEYERSAQVYADLLAEYPKNAKVWLSYGHVLKTAGRQDDCVEAYRRSLRQDPGFGEAYWSLANLKTFRFSDVDLAAMQAQVRRPELADEHRLQLHFALGKAHEDAGDHAVAFEHYSRANALHRASHPYDADLNTKRVQRLQQSFTREFFNARAGRRLRRARSDLHRGHAAGRLDAAGTDPLQPLGGRGHDGAARDHHAGQGPAHGGRDAGDRGLRRRARYAIRRTSCGNWANATSRGRASIARATGRSSSTRCRTTSCTWG